MDEEGFWVYCALDKTFGDPDLASGDLILTDSDTATTGSQFFPCPGPGIDSGGAAASIEIADKIMCHPLFGGSDTCHWVSYSCSGATLPGNLDVVGGSICWQ